MPRLGIGKSSKVKGKLQILDANRELGKKPKPSNSSSKTCKNSKGAVSGENTENIISTDVNEDEYFGCGGGCHSNDNDESQTMEDSSSTNGSSVAGHIDIENLGMLAKSMLSARLNS